MLYKATLTLFILFIFLGGLLFPVAATRMTTTVISRDLIQIGDGFTDPPGDDCPSDHHGRNYGRTSYEG
ncbi:hypothetical protein H5410_063647 [Solanum commersonii]|uniref:Uncharacterized protein n=1 Tax=Solanum commersonii TaxID=4109 RepID=A0A9J5WDT7_SOLCO|nr:hypothetical protein H5410_063647 [Solanum commersonii]